MEQQHVIPIEPNEAQSLGQRIRAERESQGLSLRALARLMSVDPRAAMRWERDEVTPQGKHLVALARVLELPTTELLMLGGIEYPHDAPTLPAMLRAEYDLPPEAIAEIERHIAKVARKYGSEKPTNKESKSSSHERRTK
jgi:transcriptional regulator with XRE-family HTH domain